MNVLTVDYASPTAPQDFALSLKETGFGILKNHPVSWAKIEKVYAEWDAFFKSEAKRNYPINTETQDGYVPTDIAEKAKGAAVKDIKEFYNLYFPWGRYPQEVSPLARSLFEDMFNLGKTLTHWLELYMPEEARQKLSEPLSAMLSMERTLFRIIHYPGLRGGEEAGAIRAAAHEDINLITLLPAATEPGLQVIGSDGKWVDVIPDPESLIINIGDMLQEATGHFYKSTTHRVINPQGADMTKSRLSMPMFIHPRNDVRLSDRYIADAYLQERLRELGLIK
ncbi:MAG: isopenicillin N synthase family oxygenase [Gammaproteobacteria bacterium]|jgi:isopenicillin N synthase-like dioxygenase|nr:isopenicillin N synthase family oxygenase [Gammaproteobacteria bacterium]